jgi:hypothetical protein
MGPQQGVLEPRRDGGLGCVGGGVCVRCDRARGGAQARGRKGAPVFQGQLKSLPALEIAKLITRDL